MAAGCPNPHHHFAGDLLALTQNKDLVASDIPAAHGLYASDQLTEHPADCPRPGSPELPGSSGDSLAYGTS